MAAPQQVPRDFYGEVQPTGWLGWVLFAGLVMLLLGIFHAIAGLIALFNANYYLVSPNGLVVNVDFAVWGWVHLILGIVVAVAGWAVMVGQTWGRVVGIVLALLSAIINLGFLPAYPVWSVIFIALDVVVIYALAVHGKEARTLA